MRFKSKWGAQIRGVDEHAIIEIWEEEKEATQQENTIYDQIFRAAGGKTR